MPHSNKYCNPPNCKSIGAGAFANCDLLADIEIPDNVIWVGRRALNNTAWYNNLPDGVVYAGKVLYGYKGTMPRETSITIKDGTTGIADYAFYCCNDLVGVVIPNTVTNIGCYAFSGCGNLSGIEIPNSITSIGVGAFGSTLQVL